MSARHVYPVNPEYRGEFYRRGFALPLIIIAILIPIIILTAWSPWVTDQFAINRIKSATKCDMTPLDEATDVGSISFKIFFGRELSGLPCVSGKFFVSAIGTVHELDEKQKSTNYSPMENSKQATSPAIKDETTTWKTYTNAKYKYSLKYPPELNFAGENPTDASTAVFINGPNDHTYNVDFPESKFIGIYINAFETKGQTLDGYLNEKYPADRYKYGIPAFKNGLEKKAITRIVIAKEQGYLATSGMLFESVVKQAWVKKGDIIFEFLATHNGETGSSYTPEAGKTFDQILFTFKFLD